MGTRAITPRIVRGAVNLAVQSSPSAMARPVAVAARYLAALWGRLPVLNMRGSPGASPVDTRRSAGAVGPLSTEN
jgi:hypothetical protein